MYNINNSEKLGMFEVPTQGTSFLRDNILMSGLLCILLFYLFILNILRWKKGDPIVFKREKRPLSVLTPFCTKVRKKVSRLYLLFCAIIIWQKTNKSTRSLINIITF